MQQSLFPIKLSDFEPSEPTAHLKKIGYDSTGIKYAVRRLDDGNWIPLTEWICYHISRLCDIPTPDFVIAHDEQEQPVFASKWEDGKVIKKSNMNQVEVISLLNGSLQKALDIVLLDQALENPDRHVGNFIFRSNSPTLMSFDFSLTQFTGTACGAYIDKCENKTSKTKKLILQIAQQANKSLDKTSIYNKIKSIDSNQLERIITSAPEVWMQQAGIDCIISWWEKTSKS